MCFYRRFKIKSLKYFRIEYFLIRVILVIFFVYFFFFNKGCDGAWDFFIIFDYILWVRRGSLWNFFSFLLIFLDLCCNKSKCVYNVCDLWKYIIIVLMRIYYFNYIYIILFKEDIYEYDEVNYCVLNIF